MTTPNLYVKPKKAKNNPEITINHTNKGSMRFQGQDKVTKE